MKAPSLRISLMMEQSHACVRHNDAVLIAAICYNVVTNTSAGLSDIGNAAAVSTLYIIIEGEECVTCKSDAASGCKICLLFLTSKGLGLMGEESLPVAVADSVLRIFAEVNVDSVISVRSANAGKEGHVENLFVLAEKPVISLLSCKTCAMDS